MNAPGRRLVAGRAIALPALRTDPSEAIALALFGAAAVVIGVLAGLDPPLALALSLGLAFVLLTLSNLATGVILFVFVTFLEVLPIGASPTVSGIKLLGLVLAVGWLGVIAARHDLNEAIELVRSHPGFTAALLLLCGWAALSIGWAEDQAAAEVGVLRLALNFALFFIFITALTKQSQVVWVYWAFVAGALASAAYGLTQTQAFDVEGRLSGAGTNANDLAAVLVSALVLCGALVAWHRRSPILRLAALACALLCAFFVFLTLSRAGLLALAVVMVIALLVASRRRGKVFVVAMLATVATVGYFGIVAPDQARERVTTIDSGTGRTDVWKLGWRMVEDRPTAGVGIANFAPSSVHYILRPGSLDTGEVITTAGPLVGHNIYLETLAELGVVGLALFLAVLGVPLAAALKAASNFARDGDARSEALARALFVAQVGMLAAAFFASIQYSKQLWVLMALGPALLEITTQTGSRPTEA